MNTPDPGRSAVDQGAEPGASGLPQSAGAPDAGLIAQWANFFFKGPPSEPVASRGFVAAAPGHLSAPAPLAPPPSPGAPLFGAYAPAQPPFGAIGAPPAQLAPSSSSPLLGGASSPTFPPSPFSQPSPPAFLQVPQPTPLLSPFAAEADFSALTGLLESALGFSIPGATTQPPARSVKESGGLRDEARIETPSIDDSALSSATAQAPAKAAPEFIVLRADQVPDLGGSRHLFDAHAVKRDFPILQQRIHGKPLVWLDNGATTQKPRAVIDRISRFYEEENSNIHRAAHTLAARATDAYEGARDKVRRFIGAGSPDEIVFVRGATEGVNLVAQSWGRRHVREGDEIVVTWLEHHANIVPWQQLCSVTGAKL